MEIIAVLTSVAILMLLSYRFGKEAGFSEGMIAGYDESIRIMKQYNAEKNAIKITDEHFSEMDELLKNCGFED